MSAKEQVLKEAPGWSEHDAEVALNAIERERAGHIVDEWGDLSEMTHAAVAETMRRLDEEERAEFGETISEAWGRAPKRDS